MENVDLLNRLKTILDLEITYPPILLSLTFFIMYSVNNQTSIIIVVIIAIAKLAIPFIIYVLYKEKKYGWIVSLILLIILPSSIIYWLIRDSVFSRYFLIIPFLLFYFFCVLLKFTVREWLTEAEVRLELENQKITSSSIKK
ncbi:MAG: hypothetical protein N3D80_14395 [Ignavibacterium album]|uniref:hypothetical protein n=1 Tax=Ignavibacterium album TaxID=591197 RepID=UPI0026F1036F|nr:hypothetical protein [Ignavibacterium album]MCX8107054.1 hypothetical protein [Ignavibacterium album]